MTKSFRRYRDGIRKTFIIYALIPVIIITLTSYILSFSSLYNTIVSQNDKDNVQIAETIGSLVESYQNQANRLSKDERMLAYLKLKHSSSTLYESLYNFVNDMELKGNFFVFDDKLKPLIQSSNYIPEYAQGEHSIMWGPIRRMQDMPDKVILARQPALHADSPSLTVGKAIVIEGQVAGFITFDFSKRDLVKLLGTNFSTSVVITDHFGYVIACTNELLINELGKIDVNFRDRSGVVKSNHDRQYVTTTEILDGEIHIYTLTSVGYFKSMLILTGLLLSLLFGMLAFTTYVSARKIAASKTKVIDDIVRAIENVQTGNLETRLRVNTNDEFQVFAEAYNQMLSDIKNLIEANKEKARQNVLSEIKQLESQFNPHFLFNTLETIRYTVKLDPSSANKMIVVLSSLLRYSIDNANMEVSLAEDVVYTKNYLFIQKYRFGNKFDYRIHVDEAVLDCTVPKLILQPIIENAIKHGFANRQSLTVQIKADIFGENLVVVIDDDGEGMEPIVLQNIRQILERNHNDSPHVGLYNVHRRVQLIYGEEYGVDLSSEHHGGTVVKITLPLSRGGSERAEGGHR
ncbi:sensor histidine kinase [Paenibacillus spongiae]|uniref:Histidine kinase n=1 Tax=Paenibacillus spongiae TaxID=2909671 RepID=A0ABY5S7A1_9BACL|nr:histidine kinase [Paenibacillus spongiae]UVI29378.1 histidine kinase [Paenibacillus spongiae]